MTRFNRYHFGLIKIRLTIVNNKSLNCVLVNKFSLRKWASDSLEILYIVIGGYLLTTSLTTFILFDEKVKGKFRVKV